MEIIYFRRMDTNIGRLIIASTKKGLCYLALPGNTEGEFIKYLRKTFGECNFWDEDDKGRMNLINEKAKQELKLYFDGKLKQFSVPLDMKGTVFQKRVWEELQKIPYGKTVCYGDIAKAIGKPRACRAVGGANHKNPIPIIVPCHRVVGSDGSLVGYGGGLKLKRFLLEMESEYMKN